MESLYDVIIIGSGPAGLTAALYTSRDNLRTLVLAGRKWGGQLMLTTAVENYPGFPDGVLGPNLMDLMKKQAERFGAEVKLVDVTKVDFKNNPFVIWTDETQGTGDGGPEKRPGSGANGVTMYQAKSVIIATGADTMWLNLPNEQRLIGKGVSSCAPCDAYFFKGKNVVVVGGGDSAMEEASVLSKFATNVTIVHRRDSFRASKIMQDRVLALPNVKTMYNSAIVDILGQDKVEGVKTKDTLNGQEEELPIDGVFVAIGHQPNTKIFGGQLDLDEKGYIKKKGASSEGLGASNTYQMATSVPGIFVAGDVHDYHFRQAVTAAGFGCMAALEVSRYLAAQAERR